VLHDAFWKRELVRGRGVARGDEGVESPFSFHPHWLTPTCHRDMGISYSVDYPRLPAQSRTISPWAFSIPCKLCSLPGNRSAKLLPAHDQAASCEGATCHSGNL
jgi:hypothetical protein